MAGCSVLRRMNPGSAGLTKCQATDTAGAEQSRRTSLMPGVWGPTSVWKARSMHSRQSSPDEDCAAAQSRAHRPSGPAGSMCVLPACSTQTTKAPAGPYDTESAEISQINVISLWKECLMANSKLPDLVVFGKTGQLSQDHCTLIGSDSALAGSTGTAAALAL